jgi:IS30 family transposase
VGGAVRDLVVTNVSSESDKELAEEGLSHRQIAKILGVTHPAVSNDLNEENSSKKTPSSADRAKVGEENSSPTNQDNEDEWEDPPPLLSVVDLNTGGIVGTTKETVHAISWNPRVGQMS